MLSEKSYSTNQSNLQRKADKYEEPKKYDKSYPQQQKGRYNDSYHQQKEKPAKQEKPRCVYKYKIERDESGINRYVLEEPINNPIKLINNYDIVCVYPSNGTKYYKNVNIYNYKNKLII